MSGAGPPTPPSIEDPVSQPEIIPVAGEEPAASPPAQEAGPADSGKRLDTCQLAFTYIVTLAQRKNLKELVYFAEQTDRQSGRNYGETRLLVVAPLILAHLISDELPFAYHRLMKLPQRLQVHPLASALFALYASTSTRQYARVYERANELQGIVSSSSFPDPALATVVSQLLEQFVTEFRRRALKLVIKAYSSISVKAMQTYTGLPANQIISTAQQLGWQYDAAQENFTLPPRTEAAPNGDLISAARASSLQSFNWVADAVANLETLA